MIFKMKILYIWKIALILYIYFFVYILESSSYNIVIIWNKKSYWNHLKSNFNIFILNCILKNNLMLLNKLFKSKFYFARGLIYLFFIILKNKSLEN